VATPEDKVYAKTITDEMESSAKARGTGIARRSPEYVSQKMEEGKAVIAVTTDGGWVGFCYIENWSHGEYVANSGLIVAPAYRKSGVAKAIKHRIFNLSREKYPDAKIFGLTTCMKRKSITNPKRRRNILNRIKKDWNGCYDLNNGICLRKKRTMEMGIIILPK